MVERSNLHRVLLVAWTCGFIAIVASHEDLWTASESTSFQLPPDPVTEIPHQSTVTTNDSQHQFPHNRTDKSAQSPPHTTEHLMQYSLNATDVPSWNAINTTDSGNTTGGVAESGTDKTYYLEAQAAVLVDQYGGAVTLVLGTVGNVLVLVTLNKGRLAENPCSLFLSVMAATDMTFILLGQGGRHFVRSISGIDLLALSRPYCQMWYVLVPALSMYADWVLVGFSAERAIAIAFPLKAKAYISSRRSKAYLLVMLLVCVGYYTYSIFYYDILQKPAPGGTTRPVCTLSQVDVFTGAIRPWLEFTINCILPATMIVISNSVIIHSLVKARRQRHQIATSSTTQAVSNDQHIKGVAGMLLGASLSFIVLTMPIRVGFVMDLVFPAQYWATDQKRAQLRLFWAINILCLYLSHAINFMLYMLTGRDFRLALTQLLCRCCCPGRYEMSSTLPASKALSQSSSVSTCVPESSTASTISLSVIYVQPSPECVTEGTTHAVLPSV